MKNLMVSLTASSVMAAGADMITVRYNCKRAMMSSKSVTMKVQMLQGGIAGLTQIRVTRSTLSKTKTETYIVKQDKPVPGLAGGARFTVGKTECLLALTKQQAQVCQEKPLWLKKMAIRLNFFAS